MSENTNIDGLKGLNFYLSKAGIDKAKLIDDENNTDSLVDIFNATEGGGSAKDPTKFVREFCNTYKDNMKNLEYDELFAFQGIMQDAVSSLEGDADSFEVSDVEKLAEILNSNDPKTRSILDNDPSAKYSADEIGIFTETYGISEDDAIQILDELHAQDNIMGNVDSSIQLLPDSTQTTDPVDTNSADNKEITQTAGAASPVSGVQTDSEAIENSNNENTQNVSSADTQVLDEKALRTLFGHSGKLFTSDFTSLSDTDKAQQANDFAKIMFSGYDIFGTKEEEPRIKNISDSLALAEYYVDTYKENHVSKSLIEAFSVDDASTDAYIGMYESLMGTDKEQEAIDLLCREINSAITSKSDYDTSYFFSQLNKNTELQKKVEEAYLKKYPTGTTQEEKLKTITSIGNQFIADTVNGKDQEKAKDIVDNLISAAKSNNGSYKNALEDFLEYYTENSNGNSQYLEELLSDASKYDELYRALFNANGSHTEVYDLLGMLTNMYNTPNNGTQDPSDTDGKTGAELIKSTPSKTKELAQYGSEYVVKSLQNLVDNGENVAEIYESDTSNVGRHAGAAYAAKSIIDMIKNGDDVQKQKAIDLAARLLFQCVDGKGTQEDLLCAIVSQCDSSILSDISKAFDDKYPDSKYGLKEFLLTDTSSDTENDKKLNALINDRFS